VKYQAVIFDLDDTLLDSGKIKWKHHKAVAKKFYGIELTDEVLREHWGKPLGPMMAIFYQHSDTPENMMVANESLAHEYPKELIAGALETVNALIDEGIEVGIVTSTLGRYARKDLARFGFPVDKFFMVQGADEVAVHKPDPRVFAPGLALLATKGIKPDRVVYVGDALIDYSAARDAGMSFMGVTTGFHTKEQFEAEGAQAAASLKAAFIQLGLS
jgi:HAD superfamily hydrolase (TIGR01549 family)